MFRLLIAILALTTCGKEDKRRQQCTIYGDKCHPEKEETNPDIVKLQEQVFALQGVISQIDNFVASDFASCNNNLPAFEAKICQIAQTATAEQQVIFIGQLQEITKIFQNELYGEDCINTTDLGCPVAGSITDRISLLEDSVTNLSNDLADLQADVTQLQADLASINSRLNNFDGSGNTIEVVITGLEADITSLEAQINALEDAINNGDVYRTFLLCGNIANSGPAYEPILITGDDSLAVAYVVSGNANGMGIVAEAGVSGNQFLTTRANTRACNFKIYDLTSSIKLCWKNDNRSATSGQIDTACNAPSFANPLITCTCIN